MNLHDMVRTAINLVNPDETCLLIPFDKQQNIRGKITPVYCVPVEIQANWQPVDETLLQSEALNLTGINYSVFLYSDANAPVSGVRRKPFTCGGDLIKRQDGTYYLVTDVVEDWSADGWANVLVTLQNKTPKGIEPVPWYKEE